MKSNKLSSPMALGIAAATSVAAVATVVMLTRRKRKHQQDDQHFSLARSRSNIHRPRRMRATSVGVTHLFVSKMFNNDFDLLITSNIEFKEKLPSEEQLRKFFIDGLCQHTRFRSIPLQEKIGGPVTWVPQRVCLADHMEFRTASSPDELLQLRTDFTNAAIKNKAVPWWEVMVVDRSYSNAQQSSSADSAACAPASGGVVLFKIHHALGDGISLAEALMELVVDENGNCVANRGMFSPKGRGQPKPQTNNGSNKKRFTLLSKVTRLLKFGIYYPLQFLANVVYILQIPTNPFGWDGRNILHDPKCHTYPPHRKQTPVFFPTHSLEFVKAVKNIMDSNGGVTVNDVEFALVAGAVRRCIQRSDPSLSDAEIKKITMRCLTPLAWPEEVCQVTKYNTLLRNNFVSIVAKLPVGEETTQKRIAASHNTWEAIKHSTLVPAYFFVFKLVGLWFPLWYRQILARDLQRGTSCLFSNVPGPQCRCFMAGEEVQSVHIFCPNIDPYMGAMSIDGQIYLAGSFYEDLGVAPQDYVDAFVEEVCAVAKDVLGVGEEEVWRRKYMTMPVTAV